MKFITKDFVMPTESINIVGLTNELKAMYLNYCLENQNKSIVLVTSTLFEANQLFQCVSNYTDKVLFFPMDDFLTSEALAISPELKIKRLETLIESLNDQKSIVITNLMGYLRFLPTKDIFSSSIIEINQGKDFSPKDLVEYLVKLGYSREIMVNKTGEFAVRGFVIDIYPVGLEAPVRIEFFGDEVESIRLFNIDNQLTIKKIDQVQIFPNTEGILGLNNSNTLEHHKDLPKFIDSKNISDYFNHPLVFFDDYSTIKKSYENLLNEITEYSISENNGSIQKYMNDLYELKQDLIVNFTNFDDKIDIIKRNQEYFVRPLNFNLKNINELKNVITAYMKNKKTIIIALNDRYKLNSIQDLLQEMNPVITNDKDIFSNRINLIVKKMNSGFEISDYVLITQNDLFRSNNYQDAYKSKFRFGTKVKDITKLEVGDYVVHYVHGIGRYAGLKTLTKNNLKKDYLQIEYRDNDKLYIPVEKIDLISKYSSGDGAVPKINKLGGTEWEKAKLKVRKKVEDIAADLLKLYAIREKTQGFAFPKDNKEQLEFEKAFPYAETADQLKVSDEIKSDMEKPYPMDRLLCGDVGYGKTEVAFRAIFKAVMAGKQVAFLCPTTILSNQHYLNALDRFKDYPINISLLNRFITGKKVKETLNKVKDGKVDILIGTHRLLSDDVEFKDLGLLVIDEEQRFGVKHKEKIKAIRNNVDVLTLSATPIPRTLQMSMSGIKSLSLIETPPVNRYPVQTYVLSENKQIIKEAISKELARNGQVFILYNNIEQMDQKVNEIHQLVPEARIISAHGKMDKTQLEDIMLGFTDKKYDVLICTTIIETGIDIPNANTLIIFDADRFGLSQLYQIRGRVGRSNKIAYCYLMYDKHKILSEIAEKRLKAIKDFTELGSGFSIAMRDLAIRGAGDILGSEQAGFVASVGIDMFLKLLEDEIKRQQGEEVTTDAEQTQPLVDVATSISDNYVQEDELKIYIHQKINEITSVESIEKLKNELSDRFGKVDDDLVIYMYEELFEKKASKLGIKDIRQLKNFIEIWLPNELVESIKIDNLFIDVMNITRMFRFSKKGNRLVITLDTVKLDKHFVYYLIELLNVIEKNKK